MDRFLAQYRDNIAQNAEKIHELLNGYLRFAVDIYGNCFFIIHEYSAKSRGVYVAIRSVSNEKNSNRFLYYMICKGDVLEHSYDEKISGIRVLFYRIIATNSLTELPSVSTLSYKQSSSTDMFEFDMHAMTELYSAVLK